MPQRHNLGRLLPNLLILILLLSGCSSQELPIDWAPLTAVIERSELPTISNTAVTTVSPYLYVSDLEWFNKRYPEGSREYHALRVHEVEHAKEQEAYIDGATGIVRAARLSSWISKYLTNADFRWEIEQRGYKAEILYKLNYNVPFVPEHYAIILSSSVYREMVSYENALIWVWEVIRNRN
jgi:hypothetical protein